MWASYTTYGGVVAQALASLMIFLLSQVCSSLFKGAVCVVFGNVYLQQKQIKHLVHFLSESCGSQTVGVFSLVFFIWVTTQNLTQSFKKIKDIFVHFLIMALKIVEILVGLSRTGDV